MSLSLLTLKRNIELRFALTCGGVLLKVKHFAGHDAVRLQDFQCLSINILCMQATSD